jgi:hypothetical protein
VNSLEAGLTTQQRPGQIRKLLVALIFSSANIGCGRLKDLKR